MPKLNDKEYQCDNCRQIFDFPEDREEKECIDEFKENFPDEQFENVSIICDDCYKKFMKWWAK